MALSALFSGEVLDGLEVERSPDFDGWLAAERRRFRGYRTALLEHLVRTLSGDEVFPHLESLLQLAPFDQRAHTTLLHALARRGRLHDGERHLAATARLFEAEGLDHAAMQAVWRSARTQADRSSTAAAADVPLVPVAARRASVAVLPFGSRSDGPDGHGGAGDSLVHDVITRLAKLRSLFVIARGSVFALAERGVGPQDAGRMLNVDYVCSGLSRRSGNRLTIAVELAETRTARVIWAEVYDRVLDDTFLVLDEIGNRIVAAIAGEIEALERNRALLKPPSSLDAWEAYHRGLWHMYRFTRPDNAQAGKFFEMAVRLDPAFSRAHAALSFTHFQTAFQGWGARAPQVDRAFAAAGQSLMADDRDPAAHWAMGRALWLRGSQEHSIVELETAIELSPNFALGHYALAFVHSQGGDAAAAIRFSDHSRSLSPFDPLLFAMLGARAMALIRLGRFEEAADWGLKAAARPNAHLHIRGIAAYSLVLAGRLDAAREQLALIHAALPHYGVDDFLTAMRFSVTDQALFRKAADRI